MRATQVRANSVATVASLVALLVSVATMLLVWIGDPASNGPRESGESPSRGEREPRPESTARRGEGTSGRPAPAEMDGGAPHSEEALLRRLEALEVRVASLVSRQPIVIPVEGVGQTDLVDTHVDGSGAVVETSYRRFTLPESIAGRRIVAVEMHLAGAWHEIHGWRAEGTSVLVPTRVETTHANGYVETTRRESWGNELRVSLAEASTDDVR